MLLRVLTDMGKIPCCSAKRSANTNFYFKHVNYLSSVHTQKKENMPKCLQQLASGWQNYR